MDFLFQCPSGATESLSRSRFLNIVFGNHDEGTDSIPQIFLVIDLGVILLASALPAINA